MNEYERTIDHAKKIFYEDQKYSYELDEKIKNLIIKAIIEKWKTCIDIKSKVIDILYQIETIEKTYKMTPYDFKNIFFMCIYALEERLFFESTIGDIKDYSPTEIWEKVELARPFIKGTVIAKIPSNPNAIYLDTLRVLKEITPISEDDILTLLNTVYDKKRKAKKPKLQLKDLISKRDLYLDFVERNPNSKELQNHLNKLNKLIETHK